MEGVEYRLSICVDGQAESTLVTVYDPTGRRIVNVELVEESGLVELTPTETGQYLVAVQSGAMQADTWRSRFGLNILYR